MFTLIPFAIVAILLAAVLTFPDYIGRYIERARRRWQPAPALPLHLRPGRENSAALRLTRVQRLVLGQMSEDWGDTAGTIAERIGSTTDLVNAARRELRQMGLAHFGPLYSEDDGRPRGSGYTLTAAGAAIKASL